MKYIPHGLHIYLKLFYLRKQSLKIRQMSIAENNRLVLKLASASFKCLLWTSLLVIMIMARCSSPP